MPRLLELFTKILVDEEELTWNEVIGHFGNNDVPAKAEELDAMFEEYHEEMWAK